MKTKIALWCLFSTLPVVAGSRFDMLPSDKFADLRKQSCTFVHVWATWCNSCVKELPKLVGKLAEIKRVTPVVIDASSPFIQDSFSRRFMLSLGVPFKLYLKPAGSDAVYLKSLDPTWPGGLPYSVLYDEGRKAISWSGSIDPKVIEREIKARCKPSPQEAPQRLSDARLR